MTSNIPDVIYIYVSQDTKVPEITWFYKKEDLKLIVGDINAEQL